MTSAIRAQREAESGFTLIELLVVVIIIGILAAIAIPAFLNQRERAWQAELTSAVRNTALDIEAEATSLGGQYPSTDAGLTSAIGFVNSETGSALDASGDGTTGPIEDLTYVAYDNAATPAAIATGSTATGFGFQLCMEHVSFNGANRVQYFGGNQGNGIQDFAETDC